MHTVLIVIHVLLAIALIGMVLVQRGPGAAAGAAFGSGASSTVFGSRGAGSFLTRTTGILAAGFFLVSLSMAILVSRGGFGPAAEDLGIMSGVASQQEQTQQQESGDVPAAPTMGNAEQDDAVPAAPVEEEPQDNTGGGAAQTEPAGEEEGSGGG